MLAFYFASVLFTARQCALCSGGVLNPGVAIGYKYTGYISLNLGTLLINEENGITSIYIWILAPLIGSILSWGFFTLMFKPTLLVI